MKLNPRLVLAAAAAVLLAAGCSERSPEPVVVPGVDLAGKTVAIGVLNDESGPVSAIGRPWGAGLRILARQVNAGGSGYLPEGWKIRLVERDHGYDPQRALRLFNEIKDQVLFIGTSFGTPNTLPLRPLLQRDQIVAFATALSSKNAEFEYTPPIAPSYRVEVGRALDWMAEQAGGAGKVRLGVVYQQDDYGSDGNEAAREAAGKLGIETVTTQAYTAGQPDYSALVTALRDAGATHVMLTTVPTATAPILVVADQLGYRPVWVGNSPAWIDRFFDSRVVPSEIFANFHWVTSLTYWGEKVPMMKPFLEAYEKYGRELAPPDHYILAAYATGLVQLRVLSRAIGSGELTRAGFHAALRGLKDYDTLGATATPLDFTRFPYSAGTQTRVLKPDFGRKSWTVVGGYAAPSTLEAPPAAEAGAEPG